MIRRLEALFSKAAGSQPTAPAVYFGRSVYSYRDLDDRANQIAQALLQAGVERGDRVGIWMEKSAAAIAAMQAILRIGACYVPLDPLAAAARTHEVIRDAKLRLVI